MKYPITADLRTPAAWRAFRAYASKTGSMSQAAHELMMAGMDTLGLVDPGVAGAQDDPDDPVSDDLGDDPVSDDLGDDPVSD